MMLLRQTRYSVALKMQRKITENTGKGKRIVCIQMSSEYFG
ncbi:hypothetical protein J502_1108 [Acinetobacter sp. 1294596]|uniref:Uncharacterized protein n=1 Tax=Acinetobacter radioresistens SK82 TaxID=596318 RepID=A0ABP2GPJ3_ACIRA|nr:hypothetical protein ACIRA0001_0968 [Acinetobacter radioresistens SK82]EXB87457.1 hypothetical protein J538_0643 [Acinetobacter sp. 272263]EXC33522.1 hypothetical protein J520_0996 [Acinetobacter sp. 869535]EXE13445.1 hypothetical protein J559_2324 [Acinetobacter sp. 983759]EXF57787.1 hypothetical protein J502_1108 [Acinetobacter sp. 1294596]